MTSTIAAPSGTARSAAIIDYILKPLERTLAYAEVLAKDIPAEKFGQAVIPGCNHPAFVFGHLSLYPARVFTMLGRSDLIVEKKGWPELFQAGVACAADDGRYPKKDEILAHFFQGYRSVVDTLGTTTEQALAKPNPIEGRMREIFPTVGIAVNFLCNNHIMMHLGQVSAWRRAAGLPAAM